MSILPSPPEMTDAAKSAWKSGTVYLGDPTIKREPLPPPVTDEVKLAKYAFATQLLATIGTEGINEGSLRLAKRVHELGGFSQREIEIYTNCGYLALDQPE